MLSVILQNVVAPQVQEHFKLKRPKIFFIKFRFDFLSDWEEAIRFGNQHRFRQILQNIYYNHEEH